MRIEISNKLLLTGMHRQLAKEIRAKLTMANPAWIDNQRMGRYNGTTDQYLHFFEQTPDDGLIVPRGTGRMIVKIARQYGEPITWDDRRISFSDVHFDFAGTLRDYQQAAVEAMLRHDWGVLCSPTGSGKTVVALAIIAARKQPALVVCHTRELREQWIDRSESFLNIPRGEIGIIGAGHRTIGKLITIGLVQSLTKCADQVSGHIGLLVADECHRAPSKTFTNVVSQFDCKYMLGLSATPYRRDGLSQVIHFYMGDCLHSVDSAALIDSGQVLRAEVITRETSFRTYRDASAEYSQMLSDLTTDPDRNRLICRDIAGASKHWDGINLVLSDRKGHCHALQEILHKEHGLVAEILTGSVSAKVRADLVNRLNNGSIKTLIATTQLLSEGFDCPALSTLFMTTPIRFSGRVLQCVGRVLRPAPGKQGARVYDYIDINVGVLAASARSRQRVYAMAA
jgi:superfamily II DNA or RNA helicase